MNKVILMGRLTADPEIRYIGENHTCVARYSLAVDRRYSSNNGEDTADFIRCVAFGKSGEFAEKYLRKGLKIAICGRIQTGSYMKEGKKVYTTNVAVEEHYFTESRAQNQGGYGNAPQNGSYGSTQQNNGAGYGNTQQNNGAGYGNTQQNNGAGYGNYGSAPAPTPQINNNGFMNIPDGIDEELPFY